MTNQQKSDNKLFDVLIKRLHATKGTEAWVMYPNEVGECSPHPDAFAVILRVRKLYPDMITSVIPRLTASLDEPYTVRIYMGWKGVNL